MREPADAERVRRLAAELGRVVPPPPERRCTWRGRSRFRFRDGNLEVFDFDLYSQALSKLERGFELDLEDVRSMVQSGDVDPGRLHELFEAIKPQLFRFPAVGPAALGAAVAALKGSR
jgi:hypothetical protein